MSDKDWFGTAGILASFALIAGATLLRGRSKSEAEFSKSRLDLAKKIREKTMAALDDYGTESYENMVLYRLGQEDKTRFLKLNPERQNYLSNRGVNTTSINDAIASAKQSFLDADRAAALADRMDEFAEFEERMAMSPIETRYPEGYEFSPGYDAYVASLGQAVDRPAYDVVLARKLRGPDMQVESDLHEARNRSSFEKNRRMASLAGEMFRESELQAGTRAADRQIRYASLSRPEIELEIDPSEDFEKKVLSNVKKGVPVVPESPSAIAFRKRALSSSDIPSSVVSPKRFDKRRNRLALIAAEKSRRLGDLTETQLGIDLLDEYGNTRMRRFIPTMSDRELKEYDDWIKDQYPLKPGQVLIECYGKMMTPDMCARKTYHKTEESRLRNSQMSSYYADGSSHSAYQAALRAIGGEPVDGNEVANLLRDKGFRDRFEWVTLPKDEINSATGEKGRTFDEDLKSVAAKSRWDEASFINTFLLPLYADPERGEFDWPEGFPEHLKGKRIPMRTVIRQVNKETKEKNPRDTRRVYESTSLLKNYESGTVGGEADAFIKSVRGKVRGW